MKKRIINYLLIATFCILFSCKNEVLIPESGFEHTALKAWDFIGPFKFDTLQVDPSATFFIKNLNEFDIDEEHFSQTDLLKIPEPVNSFRVDDKFGSIDFLSYGGDSLKQLSNVYLYSTFNSEADQDVVFIVDGSFAYKIWLNGEVVIKDYWKKNTNKLGDRLVPVKIKKGSNKIFVKVSRGNNVLSWKFNLTISNFIIANQVFFDNCLSDFIMNPNFSDSLFVYVGPFLNGKVEVLKSDSIVQLTKTFENHELENQYLCLKNLEHLEDGFYTVRLISSGYTMEEKVYKGDLETLGQQMGAQIAQLNCDQKYLNEIIISFDRFNYLSTVVPDSLSRYENQYWKNNSVFYGFNLYNLLQFHNNNKHFIGCEGTFLKSYYSEKQNKDFYFLFQGIGNPEEIASKPVIIMVPYALEGDDITTSWYISSLDQIHIDAYLAKEYGFSIAWAFLRGTNYTVPDADEDIKGIISTLEKDYNIDPTKIYLDGDCVGGMRALIIASRNPDRFAGVAAHGPITYGEDRNSPINLVKHLANVPVCIVHSTEDKAVPIAQTKHYIKEANKQGVYPVLIEKKDKGKHSISKAYHRDSFEFLGKLNMNKKQ
ncbi:MAG: dienelactone hydrolase family protein [Prolixibacteraceae bacterium]|nr:dienelactone hydrolase family protein [Prolixibacteraceae bacterium]